MAEILDIQNLSLDFEIDRQLYPALSNIDLYVESEEIIGIVGESGSGKSLTAKTILGIAPHNARITYDRLTYKGKDISETLRKRRQEVQGKEISMIFQDSGSALNPLTRVGPQIQEVLEIHKIGVTSDRKQRTLDLLEDVGFAKPETIYRRFPHELSGGMRQRIMICMALIAEPDLIIADEPTTALDTTIQKQILDILHRLIRDKGKSLIIITHDWGVINEMCDRVYVMYAGKVVEEGPVDQIVGNPQHSYTRALLKALPSIKAKGQPLFYIPFKVAAITDRRHGAWPYLEFEADNEAYIRENFPEFVEESHRLNESNMTDSNPSADQSTTSSPQQISETPSLAKPDTDSVVHHDPDLPTLDSGLCQGLDQANATYQANDTDPDSPTLTTTDPAQDQPKKEDHHHG